MQLLSNPFGSEPNFVGGSSSSVASPLDILQNDPNVQPVYAIIATPYDTGAEAETTVYLAGESFTTSVGDTPGGVTFTGGVVTPYSIQNQLFSGGEISGLSVPSFGVVEVENWDHSLDSLTTHAWRGRSVTVYVGLRENITSDPTDFASFAEVFSGTAETLDWREQHIILRVSDNRFKLETPIQSTFYAGGGGLEGDDSIKGKPKPLVYGQVRQARPVLVDPANLIYQFHDGSMEAVDAVRDKGAALNFDADYADITTATPASGEYATSLANGYIRLGASADGTVTGDVRGDNSGSLGYVSTVAGIVRKLVQDQAGLTDAELEIGSFDDLDTDNSAVVGYAVGLEERDVLTVASELVSSIGAFLTFTRHGKLMVGRVSDPSGETATFTIDDEDIWPERDGGKFLRGAANRPKYRARVGYKRYWETLSPNEVAGSVSEANRADFGEARRYVADEDATVSATYPDADTLTLDSLLDTSADASTEATRQLALYSTERDLYEVRLRTGLFRYEMGDVVEIDTTATIYGLESGKKFVVVGYVEDAGDANRDPDVSLFLWG